MKRSLKNISKLLMVTGCVSVLAYNIANAAPLVYDVEESAPQVRTEYSNPNKIILEGDVVFNDNGQKINLSLRETDVQQVLRMFADKAGLNIIFHESATGNVTLDLVNISLADAFKMVMKMTNLTYVIKDETMMVVAVDQAQSLNLTKDNVNILPVKYTDAAYIAHFLNTNVFALNAPGLSYGPIVTTNSETNELLIFGTDADYQMAKKIVDKFDKKPLMTTYRVNHTTPYEMAKMICETLLQAPLTGDSAAGSELTAEFEMGEEPSEPAEGRINAGTIACTVKSGIKTETVSSYQSKPSLTVYVQQELGTITLVGGSEHQIQMINDFIVDNDRKQPQAVLEIAIISLTENGSKEFNTEWAYEGNTVGFSYSGEKGVASNVIDLMHLNGNDMKTLSAKLTYLIKNGKGRVLSNPKIVVTNGKKSTIDLTQDYIESVTVQILQSSSVGGGATNTVQRTYEIGEDNGIKVEIMPFISPDGYVSLTMKPEYSSIMGTVDDVYTDESGEKVPYIAASLLQRRNLELTNVRIKDGETLFIGGMIYESESVSRTKVPILGDLPLIGFLFGSNKKTLEKTELMFTITPRIIKDTEDVAEL